jgi:hypothetical protein
MGSAMRGMGRSAGFSVRLVLSGVLALSILLGWTVYHANFVIGRSLILAFPGWEVSYRSAWPRLTGGAVAKDITLIPPDGAEAGTVKFSNLSISVPFFEYYVSGFSRRRGALLNAIQNLRLDLTDGHGTLNEPFTAELAAFGNFTGAPFEAEGCMNDTVWLQKEVGDMGLNPRGIDLSIAFNSEGKHLIKEQTLSAPSVGRVDIRRELIKHDDFSLFSLIETGLSEVASDEWHIKDQGFVAARNHHCALTDKISEDEFVNRHMLSVKRLFSAVGLAMTPEVEDAYRIYASKGGSLDLTAKYDPPISALKDANKELDEMLPRVQGQLTVGGKAHALALKAMTPRPLPESDAVRTTFAIVQREGAAQEAAGAAAGPAASAAPGASAASSAQSKRSTDTDINVTVNAPPPSALPPVKTAPAAAPPAEAAVVVPDADLDVAITKYADLSNYLGKYMTVHQQGRPVARVELLRAVEGGILVRRHMRGGDVDYVLDRAHFEYAKE